MLSGATTLVVEDEYLIALEIQRILEGAGAAAAIIAAPGLAGELPPEGHGGFDLAVVAIRPDNPDGPDLCTALRNRGVAVVALSATSEHADGIPGLEAVPVVVKPFSDNQLLGAATAALRARMTPPDAVS